MSILSRQTVKTEDKNKKVIGVYAPVPFVEFLALYAIKNSTSTSCIMNRLLRIWAEENMNEIQEEDLIKEASKVIAKRLKELKKLPRFNYQDFFVSLEKELIRKGIRKTTILQIIKELGHGENL